MTDLKSVYLAEAILKISVDWNIDMPIFAFPKINCIIPYFEEKIQKNISHVINITKEKTNIFENISLSNFHNDDLLLTTFHSNYLKSSYIEIKIICDHYSNGKISLPLISFLGLQVYNKSTILKNNYLILQGNIHDLKIAIKNIIYHTEYNIITKSYITIVFNYLNNSSNSNNILTNKNITININLLTEKMRGYKIVPKIKIKKNKTYLHLTNKTITPIIKNTNYINTVSQEIDSNQILLLENVQLVRVPYISLCSSLHEPDGPSCVGKIHATAAVSGQGCDTPDFIKLIFSLLISIKILNFLFSFFFI